MDTNMEKPYVVGIDIGGTNTVFGVVDAKGNVIACDSIKTCAYEKADDYIDDVCKHLLPLIIIPLAEMFKERLGVPVAVTNDANAAAIGEMIYGAARGMKDFIMITLGTGVGSGIVVNGQMVYGHDGFAGELGHVIMRRENGRSCGCGRKGCLEA